MANRLYDETLYEISQNALARSTDQNTQNNGIEAAFDLVIDDFSNLQDYIYGTATDDWAVVYNAASDQLQYKSIAGVVGSDPETVKFTIGSAGDYLEAVLVTDIPSTEVVGDVLVKSGSNVYWASGGGGVTETTNDTGLTLVATSTKYQSYSATLADLSVNLPDATTLAENGLTYIVKNSGAFTFVIRDNAGSMVCALLSGQEVVLSCIDNSVAEGQWNLLGEYQREYIWANKEEIVALYSSNDNRQWITRIDDTRQLVTWVNSLDLNAVIVTDDNDGTFSMGAIETVYTSTATSPIYVSSCLLTSTTAALVFSDETTGVDTHIGVILSISGNVITVNTTYELAVDDTYIYTSIWRVNDTQFLLLCNNGIYLHANLFNVTGTVITTTPVDSKNTNMVSGDYFQHRRSVAINAAGTAAIIPWSYSATTPQYVYLTIVSSVLTLAAPFSDAAYTTCAYVGPMHDDSLISLVDSGPSGGGGTLAYARRDISATHTTVLATGPVRVESYDLTYSETATSPDGKRGLLHGTIRGNLGSINLLQSIYYDTAVVPSTGTQMGRVDGSTVYSYNLTMLSFSSNNRGMVIHPDPGSSNFLSVSLFEVAI